uniref:Ground-like domain-containing protein n=1 Tax=Steinernema glaseri TaxID=37863 RepID=A0A1I7YWY9_9BILA
MKIVFLTLALAAFVSAQQNMPPMPQQPVNPQGANMNQKVGGAPAMYPNPPTYFPGSFPQQAPQPTSQNVCSLDATFVLHRNPQGAPQGAQGAYGQIPQPQQFTTLKCADIAVNDISSCTACCRMATHVPAVNVRTDQIEGILITVDHEEVESANTSEGYRKEKVKRSVANPLDRKSNLKCMCCSPRPIPAPYFPYAQPYPFPQPQPQQPYPQAQQMGR